MKNLSLFHYCSVTTLVWLLTVASMAAETVDFNRDVRPILSENCFHCHGFDEKHRAADLRLDTFAGATADSGGHAAIAPGNPDESKLMVRITSPDADVIMPPKDSRKVLSEQQKEILRRWIAQGAKYDKHWAFLNPLQPSRLATPHGDTARGEKQSTPTPLSPHRRIDDFIEAKLAEKKWSFSPPASAEKWIRRVSFDLLGIAPSPAEVDRFIAATQQQGEKAYAEAVDALLLSPRFGERMSQDWLDAARYADTHGFNNDSQRSMWRWRDWVIDAFNNNLPYDLFLTKQLAGDLIPNATLDDQIATGYCRNHVINSEGGIIEEEYRVEYVVDRVRTLGTSILGLTLECARCHDHKFDPITQKDFYRLYAFFNQVDEVGEDGRVANAFPLLAAPTAAEVRSLAELDNKLQQITEQLDVIAGQAEKELVADKKSIGDISIPESSLQSVAPLATGEHPLNFEGKIRIEKTVLGQAMTIRDENSFVDWEVSKEAGDHGKAWTFSVWLRWNGKPTILASSMKLNVNPSSGGYGSGLGIEVNTDGAVEVKLGNRWPAYSSHIIGDKRLTKDDWANVVVTHDGTTKAAGLAIFVNGEVAINTIHKDGTARKASPSAGGKVRLGRHDDAQPSSTPMTFAAPKLIPKSIDPSDIAAEANRYRLQHLSQLTKRSTEQNRELLMLHLETSDSPLFRSDFVKLRAEMASLVRKKIEFTHAIETTMVMRDEPRLRDTFVLNRGQYNVPGEKVEAGVPEELLAAWPADAPKNRLGLAQWLTQPNHPLTARVAVNRFWQQLFGVGLVKSAEDFGFQGEYPSHPELLDWLARDFVSSGWDVKRLMKQLVLSKTYRQTSNLSGELRTTDPENRWLARGPRFRLPAENIRDHLLDIGGLLRHRVGGPSVFPKQPEGLYEGIVVAAAYPGTKWLDSQGDDLYRRSIYTFWKRTVPFPVLNVFDAPDREVCVARRSKTNTPLQALTLMNEPSMLDAARGLAERMLAVAKESNEEMRSGLAFGFRLGTGRRPSDAELDELNALYESLRFEFSNEAEEALRLLGRTKETNDKAPNNAAEQAALVAVSNVILNLDETITKD